MTPRTTASPPPTAASQARLAELRAKHSRFLYESFVLDRAGNALRVKFRFRIEPDIEFTPQTFFEGVDWQSIDRIPKDALENLFFHLGLIEMLSYWKASCSPEIVVRAGALNAEQIAWWDDLLRQGMGEFFFVNQIAFRSADFVKIVAAPANEQESEKQILLPPRRDQDDRMGDVRDARVRDLVLTSGGKDSVVTLELLREALLATGRPFDCLLLNPTDAALAIARRALLNHPAAQSLRAAGQGVGGRAGCTLPIVVRRTIDPRLLALNAAGYLNGHTPFSALLAFLGVTVAALLGHSRVIVSNERSAEEAGVEYLGEQINHQYSKTFRFETAFRQYSQQYLAPGIEYFSLLRPLYELQIARLFSRHPQYFPLFRSCNRGMASNSWCGRCPKCLFVYTALFPFLEREQILALFGAELFAWEGAAAGLHALLGLDQNKPFECVGTKEETLAAIHLCVEKYRAEGIALPAALRVMAETVLRSRHALPELAHRILTAWSDQHHLPLQLAELLRPFL